MAFPAQKYQDGTQPAAPPWTLDPTKNVLDLVAAESRRQDDLRHAQDILVKERHEAFRRELDIRTGQRREIADLHSAHAAENLRSEARRLDALRELDRVEARTANERHQAAVDTLAKATAAMADTLRASNESTARSLAAAAEASKKEHDARISALERSQAAGSGKGAGLQAFWGYLLGAAGFLAAIVALASRFMK